MPISYCLIPDASGTRLLLKSGPEGWTLSAVEHDYGWFAHEAVAVARQLGDRLGIRLVALREVEEAGLHLCELVNVANRSDRESDDGRHTGPSARLVCALEIANGIVRLSVVV